MGFCEAGGLKDAVIVFDGVWVRYGSTIALEDVSVRIGEGLTLITGPNGSGKTTLLRVLAGVKRPSRGRVFIRGVDIYSHIIPSSKGVNGLVGEEMLPYWLTGMEYMEYIANMAKASMDRMIELAERLDLTQFLGKRTWELSSGNKKKLLLVIALSVGSDILVIDEPFATLDPKTVRTVAGLILGESRKRPVVVSTHVLSAELSGASRLLFMMAGKIMADYNLKDVLSVDSPIFRAKLREIPRNPLELAKEIGASEITIEGRTAYVMLTGRSLLDCLEQGICSSYTIDISKLLSSLMA